MGQGPRVEGGGGEAITATRPLWHAYSLGLAALSIGMTLALAPAYVATLASNNAIVAFVLGSGAMLAVAVAVSVFAERCVTTGSLMSYVRLAFGPWAQSLVGAALLTGYVVMIPSATAATQIFVLSALDGARIASADAPIAQAVTAFLLLASAATFACRGLDTSVRVATVLAFACVPPVLFLMIASLGGEWPQFDWRVSLGRESAVSMGRGAVVALIFFLGFEGASTLAAETPEPRRTVPTLLMSLVVIVAVLGVAATIVQMPVLALHQQALAAGESPVAILAEHGNVAYLRTPVDLLLVLSGIAALIGVLNYAARIVATAANDGLLPVALGVVDSQTGVPRRAILLLTGAALVLLIGPSLLLGLPPVVVGSYLASAVVYCWLAPYLLICVGAVRLELRAACRPGVVIASTLGAGVMLVLIVGAFIAQESGPLAWLPASMALVVLFVFQWFWIRASRTSIPSG